MQWVNTTANLGVNLYILAGRCRWFSNAALVFGTLQWSMWNALFLLIMV